MKKKISLLISNLFLGLVLFAQSGGVEGKIIDEISNEPIPFAAIVISGTTIGTTTNFDGEYSLKNVNAGFVRLEISVLGYAKKLSPEIQILSNKIVSLDIKMEKSSEQMKELVVESDPFVRPDESPLSMQTIGVTEIERAAGANRDISKVIQSFPGVASSPAFRNDIIIRGGAPNENRFYLDEIEVPNINHFQTQGASGGPVGLINVNLIREVDFQSGAFSANRGNMLSSLLSFKQIDGNNKKLKGKVTLGSSDLGISLDGPLGKSKKLTFVFSARQSYLQFLFQALDLPFLPTYWDYQTKVKYKINTKNEISLISMGALDKFKLNTEANETKQQRYILANIPVNEQWNYTIGLVYKHYKENSFQTFVLSRNMLNNEAYKYANNDENDPDGLIQNYKSQEIENKFRFENNSRMGDWKFVYGVNYEFAKYNNSTYNRIVIPESDFGPSTIDTIDFSSDLNLNKYGLFAQLTRRFFSGRLTTSIGIRFDGNDYNTEMSNLLNQASPRLGVSYDLTDKWSLNFAMGRFTQLPAYTIMGYQENGEIVNKNNGLKYITANHINGGVEWRPLPSSKITVEGFYKYYQNYPLSLRKGISLANLGAGFGVVGNEPVSSSSEGRAYGVEVLAQQKLTKGFYGILSYTWVRSEFTNANQTYAASSWDSEHLLTLTAGKKFKKNWELGAKWRYVHGRPYTPYLIPESYNRATYDINPSGVPDYTRVNSERLPAFHQLDVRVDKTFEFSKWSLNLYLDIQNLYNFQSEDQPILYPVEDAQGDFVVTNPSAPYNQQVYDMETIPNSTGTVLPTIGVIIDF
ncbi:MAG: TonB-dependent receptor [Salibacteraceae bacterium]